MKDLKKMPASLKKLFKEANYLTIEEVLSLTINELMMIKGFKDKHLLKLKTFIIENNLEEERVRLITKTVRVAIITPVYSDYLNWITDNQKENETYFFVDSMNKARRYTNFDRVEKAYNHYLVEDIGELLAYLTMRSHFENREIKLSQH